MYKEIDARTSGYVKRNKLLKKIGLTEAQITEVEGKRFEEKIKEEAGLSSRCMPFEQEHISDKCVCCGKPAKAMTYWGKAY